MSKDKTNVSPHFKRWEFACKCGCKFTCADVELIDVLENIRVYFDSPIRVTSACRCPEYNKKVGGAKRSKHTKGIACDIQVHDIKPKVVADYVCRMYPGKYGVGRYSTFTHIDMRPRKTRWGKN